MSMKEAKKSALMGLIKSMNKKRHTPKPAPAVEEEDPAEEAAESPDEEAHEMELGQEDGEGQEPGMEDMVKGFMKHGRERMPAPKAHGTSLTVIMGSAGKRKK
jgi:hypothetical protein